MSAAFYHAVNLASDPETHILDKETKQLIPASEVLEVYFDIRGIKEGEKFFFSRDQYKNNFTRTLRETKVGNVHQISPVRGEHDRIIESPTLVVDGTALEINTIPVTCRQHMIQCTAKAINAINDIISTLNNEGWNLELCVDPTIPLSPDTLSKLPEQAAVFGCDADMDIYNKVALQAKVDASKYPFRHTGGHLHMSFGSTPTSIGWLHPDVQDAESRMKFFAENLYRLTTLYDRLIGIATTVVNTSPLEGMRRGVYGQAGRVRLQPYGGIEYRTPSSYWLLDSSLLSYTALWAQVANNVIFQPELEEQINSLFSIDHIVNVINTGDSQGALEVLTRTHEVIKQAKGLAPFEAHQSDSILKYAKYVFENGGSHVVFDPALTGKRWNRLGFVPLYGKLSSVDTFVNMNVK